MYSFKSRRDRMLHQQNTQQVESNELCCCEGDDEQVGESGSISQDGGDVSTSISTKSSQAEIVVVPGSITMDNAEQGDKAAWLKVRNMKNVFHYVPYGLWLCKLALFMSCMPAWVIGIAAVVYLKDTYSI